MADDAAFGVEQIDLDGRVERHRVHRQVGQGLAVGCAVGTNQRPWLLRGDGGGEIELQSLRGLQRILCRTVARGGEQCGGQQREQQQHRGRQAQVQAAVPSNRVAAHAGAPVASKR
jgi:hypothetical protein